MRVPLKDAAAQPAQVQQGSPPARTQTAVRGCQSTATPPCRQITPWRPAGGSERRQGAAPPPAAWCGLLGHGTSPRRNLKTLQPIFCISCEQPRPAQARLLSRAPDVPTHLMTPARFREPRITNVTTPCTTTLLTMPMASAAGYTRVALGGKAFAGPPSVFEGSITTTVKRQAGRQAGWSSLGRA